MCMSVSVCERTRVSASSGKGKLRLCQRLEAQDANTPEIFPTNPVFLRTRLLFIIYLRQYRPRESEFRNEASVFCDFTGI